MTIVHEPVTRVVYALPGLGKSTFAQSHDGVTDFDDAAKEILGAHKQTDVGPYFADDDHMRSLLTSYENVISPIHVPRYLATTLAFVVPPRHYIARLVACGRDDLLTTFSEKTLIEWAETSWRWSNTVKGRIVLNKAEFVSTYDELILNWFDKTETPKETYHV